MSKKVFVGLSGGVDSAVASLLLLKQGYDVTGVFMKNWSGEDYGITDQCPWKEDLEAAREVAKYLSIELKVYNFEKEYRELVVKDFFYQYSIGNTPNPDILCNKFIKFDKFLEKAIEEGADYIATGHYAHTDGKSLFNAKDANKDQTYFLHQLTEAQLSHALFPLEELNKSEVREIAKKEGLPNYARKDSQGICFIGKVDIQEFLKQELKEKTGNIIDVDSNKVVGKHIGVWFYTIGQRQGLNVGGLKSPYFVSSKDVENNILYVAQGKKNPKLWTFKYEVGELHLINNDDNLVGIEGVIRYRGTRSKVEATTNGTSTTVTFEKPQWGGAVGQSIVLYKDRKCLGGGAITKIVE
ncbi:tRNA 2-thiouridine(34) synthase MnmA [Candidatus Dojkabacteria bacterium]|nr:tRNA 2-thiouridine(34) synthase MnmA [Candidatus Dojkabacteria bacterium]